MPECVLFATTATKGGYTLQIADDAGAVVDIMATAGGTGVQGAFIDMAAFVADGDAHVHAEVVAAGLCGDVQERAVAGCRQGFVEVQVQRRAAVEPVHQFFAVQQEFVERVDFFVLDDVEIGVVAFAADFVAVGFVPFGVFHAEVFGGDKLGVELHAVASRSLHIQLTACVATPHTLPMNHSELKKQRVGCVRYARTRSLDCRFAVSTFN